MFPPAAPQMEVDAVTVARKLCARLGRDAYTEWFSMHVVTLDYGRLYREATAKLLEMDDCNCVVDGQSCPACRTKAAEVYPLEQQF